MSSSSRRSRVEPKNRVEPTQVAKHQLYKHYVIVKTKKFPNRKVDRTKHYYLSQAVEWDYTNQTYKYHFGHPSITFFEDELELAEDAKKKEEELMVEFYIYI